MIQIKNKKKSINDQWEIETLNNSPIFLMKP